MKLLGMILMLAASALAQAGPEHAPNSDPVALDAQMRQIAAWLSENFELPATESLPRVERVSPERMHTVRHRGEHGQPAVEGAREVEALYEDATRTIYLHRDWQGATPAEISVLVHELVHHLQNLAGLKYACAQARERPAYVAQDRWLGLSGRNLLDEFGLDPMTVLVRTHCMH